MPKNFVAAKLICLAAIAVLALCASLVPADDVYLTNGKRYEGRVTTQGDQVIIEMEHGTITTNRADVLAIEPRELPAAMTRPSPLSASRPSTDAANFRTAPGEMQMPESYAFMYMRNIASSTATVTDSHKMVQSWQAKAHDRMRRDGSEKEWVTPAEFDRRREAFKKLLNDATVSLKAANAMALVPTTNPIADKDKDKAKKAKLLKANEQFVLAAEQWPDPLLRRFLMGVARSNAAEHAAALDDYRKCCADAPLVAAFHQGYALSLLGLDRPLEAMEQCLQVLRLEPDSSDAVSALCKAMAAVKGAQMTAPAYLQAAKVLRDYTDPVAKTATSASFNWAMPGKSVASKDGSLPVFNYDRLVFRQAIAVPIAEHVLLVDRQLIDRTLDPDSVAVFVRIDDKTVVPARFHKVAGSTMAAKTESPFAVVTVDECTFTPISIDEKLALTPGQGVTVTGLSIYEEMGDKPRTISANVLKPAGQDEPALSEWLAPGEAAGPIFLSDTGLLGFVAGKTDVTADFGGPDKIIPIADVAAVVKKSKRYTPPSSSGQAKRKITPTEAKGTTFTVYATAGEVVK
jgi:hypothetical protein